MKQILLLTIVGLVTITAASAQDDRLSRRAENEIRKLEFEQIEYLLRGDVESMEKRWAPGYTVNNPFQEIMDARQGPIRTGKLTYSKFERDIQKFLLHGSTAVVMGIETVVPNGNSRDAGRTINRRFTDVWMKINGKWLMIARHANELCSNQSR